MVQWWYDDEEEEEEEKHFLLLTRHQHRGFNVEASEKRRFVFINQSRNSKPFSFLEQMPSNFRFSSEPEKQMWNEFNWSLDELTIKTRKRRETTYFYQINNPTCSKFMARTGNRTFHLTRQTISFSTFSFVDDRQFDAQPFGAFLLISQLKFVNWILAFIFTASQAFRDDSRHQRKNNSLQRYFFFASRLLLVRFNSFSLTVKIQKVFESGEHTSTCNASSR